MSRLSGLQQAVAILQHLGDGRNKTDVILLLNGDKQLADMWISFLVHNNWMEGDESNGWIVTEKGREWVDKLKDGRQ